MEQRLEDREESAKPEPLIVAAEFMKKLEALFREYDVKLPIVVEATVHNLRVGRLGLHVAVAAPRGVAEFADMQSAPHSFSAFFFKLWNVLDAYIAQSQCYYGTCVFVFQRGKLMRAMITRSIVISRERDLMAELLF